MIQSEQPINRRAASRPATQAYDGPEGLSVPPPGPWWRTTMAGAIALAIGIGLLALIYFFARPLALIILGLTLAAALLPVANWLDRWLPRGLAVILIYLVLGVILAALLWVIFPPLVNQTQQAAEQIPQLVNQVEQRLTGLPFINNQTISQQISSQLGNVSSTLTSLPFTLLSALFSVVMVIFISIYALIAAPAMSRFARSLAPERAEGRVTQIITKVTQAVGGYVRGVMIDSIIVGILTYVGLLLIGVQFPLVLGVMTGLLEIIPIVGPIIAGIIVVAVALLQSPTQALIALVFMIVLQQVEGEILVPNIMHRETLMSPLLVLVAVVLGEGVGGIVAILVAIPLAAALRVLFLELVAPAFRRWTGASRTERRENEELPKGAVPG